ncbi:2-amino-4-hydroxy-6-hydroxymethyldihydropteridine diphosphokinase [Phocicoccus pinnipedialis]|uniref:2-amino-4-hydroxy-6-hydroxymethyldihydropteridine diphosphokinase n=1 Tax=Phocicoccus pinnipedialis TaxID=110845 RepID=A0A6V7R3K4_9BACL|nr:2-amino-4-hydroxy-6-hydroxymethyldihydropteridine diphosphokinase [Jeotgalicoccus pinnipedialis]MBP1940085.1 2-amino-4-hydroxy-6-hydroxymethyldihydropteridine diphosphokinase [Jeotgalicoccus pinnipedialis]CAD2071967.1 Bifunctional folate synthesis protein [Jeotgalicoccus pinnipedialis]
MAIAYLGLGTNIGERYKNLRNAIELLAENPDVTVRKESQIYETAPYGMTDQPDFLNMVIEVETNLSPTNLLYFGLEIEEKLGRVRKEVWGPRIIDVDVLIYEDLELNIDDLTVPHIEMHKREFVLEPFNEIAPKVMHPTFKKTIQELYKDLKRGVMDV